MCNSTVKLRLRKYKEIFELSLKIENNKLLPTELRISVVFYCNVTWEFHCKNTNFIVIMKSSINY